jgi:hypothetical protein
MFIPQADVDKVVEARQSVRTLLLSNLQAEKLFVCTYDDESEISDPESCTVWELVAANTNSPSKKTPSVPLSRPVAFLLAPKAWPVSLLAAYYLWPARDWWWWRRLSPLMLML